MGGRTALLAACTSSQDLSHAMAGCAYEVLGAGSLLYVQEEVELRAATIVATDLICAAVNAGAAAASASAGAAPRVFAAVEVDWLLWQEGERRNASGEIPTHHRTLTCFY